MSHGIDAVAVPLPFPRATIYVLTLQLPGGWALETYGQPGFEGPSDYGSRTESRWGFQFPCGLGCWLQLQPDVTGDWLQVYATNGDVDVEHCLRHLNLEREWLIWDHRAKLDKSAYLRKYEAIDSFWSVLRQDDYGNKFVAAKVSSEEDAQCVAGTFERRGHKQMYWVERSAS
jgi:hypothetical protein